MRLIPSDYLLGLSVNKDGECRLDVMSRPNIQPNMFSPIPKARVGLSVIGTEHDEIVCDLVITKSRADLSEKISCGQCHAGVAGDARHATVEAIRSGALICSTMLQPAPVDRTGQRAPSFRGMR